jgi:hypothetical protein
MRQNHLGHTQEQHEEVVRDRFDRFVWLGLLCVRVKKKLRTEERPDSSAE